MPKFTLEGWISDALSDTDRGGPCSALSLEQVQGMATQEVITLKLEGKSFTAKQWAEQFQYKAEQRAANLHGTIFFKMLAFYGGSSTPGASFPLKVEEGGNAEFSGMGGYSNNKDGFLNQAMHHVQVMHGQIFARQAAVDAAFQGMVSSLYQRNIMLEGAIGNLVKENLEAVSFVKQLILEKVEGDHKRKMEQLQFERASAERNKWMSFAPALVNTIAGREVFPQAIEDTALVNGIVDNIKVEDLPKIMGLFPPEVQGMIMDRATRRMKEKEEEARKAKELSEGTADARAELDGEIH